MATIRSGCMAMPRYYFDIREGLRFRPDRAGEEFEDLGNAKGHAVHFAGDRQGDAAGSLQPCRHHRGLQRTQRARDNRDRRTLDRTEADRGSAGESLGRVIGTSACMEWRTGRSTGRQIFALGCATLGLRDDTTFLEVPAAMPSDQPDPPISKSEQSQRSVDETMDQASRAIEAARAEVARSRALTQSEADIAREIDRISEENGAPRANKNGA
jgi:hypothetical protein